MSEEEKPACFGYFMSGKECSNCQYLQECYLKWKRDGEPKQKSRRVFVKENKKCNCQDL